MLEDKLFSTSQAGFDELASDNKVTLQSTPISTRALKSPLWQLFTPLSHGALCTMCEKVISRNKNNSSSNMWLHLQKAHEAEYMQLRQKRDSEKSASSEKSAKQDKVSIEKSANNDSRVNNEQIVDDVNGHCELNEYSGASTTAMILESTAIAMQVKQEFTEDENFLETIEDIEEEDGPGEDSSKDAEVSSRSNGHQRNYQDIQQMTNSFLANSHFPSFNLAGCVPYNASSSAASEVDEKVLRAPFEYIRRMPGKQIRSQLAVAFNVWMNVEESKLTAIMDIVEMLHNASLLIDDIEDDSVLRRGLPVTHSIFGAPRTINSANYMYFVALEACLQLGHPCAVNVYTEQLLELHRGQGKELFWRDTVTCPTIEQYEAMVLQKTGGLFFLAVRLMQLFSRCPLNFTPLLSALAIFFQIRDDLLNLSSEEMAKQKTPAEDLTEGKFSYPVILALQGRRLQDDEVLNILRQRPKSLDVKLYCVEVIKERKAFEQTRHRLRELTASIEREIRGLGGNARFDYVMQLLQKDLND